MVTRLVSIGFEESENGSFFLTFLWFSKLFIDLKNDNGVVTSSICRLPVGTAVPLKYK